MYTAVPAKGKEPLPPANLSLISPPDPVAAPLKGSTVVGKLCVSAFRDITLLIFSLEKLLGVVASFGTNCSISGPSIKATLSLYADTILFGFFFDVFLINSKRLFSFGFPLITNLPLKILCRQCSELTCENPKTSESVRNLPRVLERSLRYLTSSSLKANPSVKLYSAISFILIILSGLMSTSKMF